MNYFDDILSGSIKTDSIYNFIKTTIQFILSLPILLLLLPYACFVELTKILKENK